MARSASLRISLSGTRLLLGFAAGFLATITFHQIGIWALHATGITPALPWQTGPVPPFNVPRIVSLAFWGGVWGIVFVLVERWLARFPGGYWVGAVLFGAVVPTLVFWFVVLPLRGAPVGGGGGRPDFAEAGGKQPEKIDEMLAASEGVLARLLA